MWAYYSTAATMHGSEKISLGGLKKADMFLLVEPRRYCISETYTLTVNSVDTSSYVWVSILFDVCCVLCSGQKMCAGTTSQRANCSLIDGTPQAWKPKADALSLSSSRHKWQLQLPVNKEFNLTCTVLTLYTSTVH